MAFREEHLSGIFFSFTVGFTYKGRTFSFMLTEQDKDARFGFTEVKNAQPRVEDILWGTLQPSETAAAKIFWDGAIPSDLILCEAMDTIVGYMVERGHLTAFRRQRGELRRDVG